MDIIGTSLSAAQTLIGAVRDLTDALQFYESFTNVFSYESELKDLQTTVEKITEVLREAENKLELSNDAKFDIKELKDVVFETDYLVDEIVTLAHLQKRMDADGTLFEKVSHFFSTSNPICVSFWMSRGIKDIKKKLDDAIANNNKFSFKHDPQPIRNRRPETCSYVDEVEIIGREDDLEKIVGMLLHPSDDQCDRSFLSVVGIGGLGKTALAQLVFNDSRVKSAFSCRKWTCVADQDQEKLNVKGVLCKILQKNDEGSYLEQVQAILRGQLAGERYLLVLDDVWTEDRYQWCQLVKFLVGGQRGSWIMVTTRSHKTATIVGGEVHKLRGLSKGNSWSLFERTAFTSDQSSKPPEELFEIGRKIIDRCAGVPLAIKVAGTLLYGQDKSKWQSVQEIGLANFRESENNILPILKLSFHHLESPLKSCFAYCALFPKDFRMEKEMLKSLWMAQGYVVPLYKGQSIEDACEEYISILLKRCFFQDIKKDDHGEVYSFKIHDLMHDIALDVAGEEILYATRTVTENLNKRVRHLSVANMGEHGNYSVLRKTRIRSHLYFHSNIGRDTQYYVEALVENCKWLRALDLSGLGIKSLPDCIGDELLHLRYLDLSDNYDLQVLPKSFSKLCNLQTLNLRKCRSLRELPRDLGRLVNLRLLALSECWELRYINCRN